MAKMTMLFGMLLITLGVAVWLVTGRHAPTALIPAYVGIVLAILGLLARRGSQKKRMTVMHIAVTIGVLGFLATVKGIWDYVRMSLGHHYARPLAVEETALMSAILLFFVLLCVRSFIHARRAPAAEQAAA